MVSEGIKYTCDHCGQLIEIGRTRYIFKGELTAAYDGDKFDETHGGSLKEIQAEMARIIKLMEQKSEQELTDEVHFSFKMDLCPACRKKVYDKLLNNEF